MRVTTVCGDIAPSELGFTSMHEHTMLDFSIAGRFTEAMFPDIREEQLEFIPENYGFLKTGTFLASKELQKNEDFDYFVKEI